MSYYQLRAQLQGKGFIWYCYKIYLSCYKYENRDIFHGFFVYTISLFLKLDKSIEMFWGLSRLIYGFMDFEIIYEAWELHWCVIWGDKSAMWGRKAVKWLGVSGSLTQWGDLGAHSGPILWS